MRNILLVMRREMATMLRRPSFWVAALIAPAILGVVLYAFSFLNTQFGDNGAGAAPRMKPAGYIDQAGVVRSVPAELHAFFVPYPNEDTATAALRVGTIGSYFVVAPDYMQSGRVVRVSQQATFTSGSVPDTRLFTALLRSNLAGNEALARRLDRPLDLRTTIVGRPANTAADASRAARDATSLALALLLAFSIVNGGGWLVQAVAEEKENRTIEVILTSVRPWQLMAGKLLGLGTLALLQFGIWVALGRFLLGARNPVAGISLASTAPGVWIWTFVFFLLGFLFVSAIMTALGAVGASVREGAQISGFITLPVLAPIWFAPAISDNPGGLLSRVLTFVPITAPVTVMLRLGQGSVPLPELLLSVALLVLAIFGAVWLAARLFRGATLLTGVRPTPLAVWRALRQA